VGIKTMAWENLLLSKKTTFVEKTKVQKVMKMFYILLAYVPSHEMEIVREYCLKGTKDKGGSKEILFINNR